MRESESRAIVGDWVRAALEPPDTWDLPVADVERELRHGDIPDPAAWAISEEAHVLWMLGPSDTFYTVRISTEDKAVESTEVLHLKGETINVRQGRRQRPAPGVIRETAWSFTYANNQPLLSLVGRIYAGRAGQPGIPDQRERFAQALGELAQRNAN